MRVFERARRYGPEVLARVAALAEADPTREACGLVLARGGRLEVVALKNVADAAHAADPAAFPRTARDAYLMDPSELLRVLRALDRDGGALAAVWHSHVEADATLSADDVDAALADGAPLLPGAEQLVVSVRGGRATETRRYVLEGERFVARPLP